MNPWRWVDPRVRNVRLVNVRAYFLGHGWKQQRSPNPNTLIFARRLPGTKKPFSQAMPASEHFVDYPQRMTELITVLSEIEDRHPVDLLDDIMRAGDDGGQTRAANAPRPVMATDLGAFHRLLGQYGLSLGQFYILRSCAYGPMPDWGVVGDAIGESVGNAYGPISQVEAKEGLEECITNGWIRVVDEAALREIQSIVEGAGGQAPLRSLPGIGDVHFTLLGAERYCQLCKDVHGEYPGWDEAIEVETPFGRSAYCPTLAVAQDISNSYRQSPDVADVTEPVRIGPWFGDWWQHFPTGYRVDILEREKVNQGQNPLP